MPLAGIDYTEALDMPKVSVQLSDEIHAAAKVRALQDGVTLNDLGRVWFEAYGLGGTVVASTETTVRSRKGDDLAAGGFTAERKDG